MKKWNRLIHQPNLPLYSDRRVTSSPEHISFSKEAAKEGMVLLKNTGNILPLPVGTRVALFGKGTFDYVKGGGGSGDVYVSYIRNLYDGLKMLDDSVQIYEPLADFYRKNVQKQYELGAVPGMAEEPLLSPELADSARAYTDTAIVSISRFSGEGWDRSDVTGTGDKTEPWPESDQMIKTASRLFPDGDFYLTAQEKSLLNTVMDRFEKIIIVLNIGGMIDLSWAKNNEKISGVLLGWQGGMEGGLAMAELLTGKSNPSGKLADTFANRLEDYPSTAGFHDSIDYVDYSEDIYVGYRYFETIPHVKDKVTYPFGFGLSYTTFRIAPTSVWDTREQIFADIQITNTGNMDGKEVVQIYFEAPQGLLKKPARQLAAFCKTRLLKPGETQLLCLSFKKSDMASYDDLGKIAKSAYILEKGTYKFYIGTSVRDTQEADFHFTLTEDQVTEQLAAHLTPTSLKERMLSDGSYEQLPQSAPHDMNECAFEKMLPGTEECIAPAVRSCARRPIFGQDLKPQFIDVAEGKLSLDDFIHQMPDEDLIHLLGGQPNIGVTNTFGFGTMPDYGIPPVMTADGPAGIRITGDCFMCTTAWPCATLLASTWNPELVEQVGQCGAKEARENNLALWLTPAVNIHRNPLCGRNFEYYSEDPLVAGKMGAAMVKGIQSQHIGASVKHFAANNKETNRKHSDSRVSERALREIYLKVFEIIVKEAHPWSIMSSYNAINGWRASENHELLEDILRGEWGFDGMVTSDWWTRGEHYKEVKAGNDLKMATGFPERVQKALDMGELDRSDIERSVKRVLELILKFD